MSAIAYLVIITVFYDSSAYTEFYDGFHLTAGHMGYYAAYYLEGFVGIAFVFSAAEILKNYCRLLDKAGYFSIDVYVLHMFFVKIGKAAGSRWQIFDGGNCFPVWIYSFIIVVFIVFWAEYVLRKFSLYRLSIGGR